MALGAIVLAGAKQGVNLAQQVLVVNSASQPVPTSLNNSYNKPLPTDTDYAARTQLNFSLYLNTYTDTGVEASRVYTVPKGYIFVVDRFSALGSGVDQNSLPTEYNLTGLGGPTVPQDDFVAQVDSASTYPSALVNPTASGMAVQGGTSLYIFADTAGNPDGDSLAIVNIRGHLIPVGVNVEFTNAAADLPKSSGLTLQEIKERFAARKRHATPR
jgi:hypothetical protein